MEQAAKLREDEVQKEKELRLMKIREEHMPIERMELKKHMEVHDRNIVEAQDRRRFDRLGGQSFRDI